MLVLSRKIGERLVIGRADLQRGEHRAEVAHHDDAAESVACLLDGAARRIQRQRPVADGFTDTDGLLYRRIFQIEPRLARLVGHVAKERGHGDDGDRTRSRAWGKPLFC